MSCRDHFDPAQQCQCNTFCEANNDCCPDYSDTCGGSSGQGLFSAMLLYAYGLLAKFWSLIKLFSGIFFTAMAFQNHTEKFSSIFWPISTVTFLSLKTALEKP
jgi:hypothetical protein